MTHQAGNRINSIHHQQALRACLPFLNRGPQNILDIGRDPLLWLRTIERFGGSAHRLAGCVQNADAAEVSESSPYPVTAVELDIWSPLARNGLPAQLPGGGYTLITALNLIDHLYHPQPFFSAVGQVLKPGGILLLTAANISSRENLLALLRGDGVAPDLDAVVGLKAGPRPRVRQYSWREIANVALSHNFVPVRHGFFDAVPPVPSPAASLMTDEASRFAPESAFGALRPRSSQRPAGEGTGGTSGPWPFQWLLTHPHQLSSHFYLLLERTSKLPGLRFSGYMLRHATRATLRFGRERIAQRIRAMASA